MHTLVVVAAAGAAGTDAAGVVAELHTPKEPVARDLLADGRAQRRQKPGVFGPQGERPGEWAVGELQWFDEEQQWA